MAPRPSAKRNAHENDEVASKKSRGTTSAARATEQEAVDVSDDDGSSGTLSESRGDESASNEHDADGKIAQVVSNDDDKDEVETEITTSTRHYFEEELVIRLNNLNAYRNDATGCATLHTVPFDKLAWGSINGGRNMRPENLYCNGSLFMLWIVGEITARSFLKEGNNVRRPTIRIQPLLPQDLENAHRLLTVWAKPTRKVEFDRRGLWASRWVGDQSMADDTVPAFERYYDALDTYKRKSDMPRLAAHTIKRGDIVLAEVFVSRWIPKDDADDSSLEASTSSRSAKSKSGQNFGKGKRSQKEWRKWNVQLTLDAISLLYPGSDYWVDEAKPDEEVEL